MNFWDRIIIWLNELRLKAFRKKWSPNCKDYEFCCIVCGRVHRNIIFFDSPKGVIKLKGRKTAKKLYTLDFCSAKCMNWHSQYTHTQLLAFNKINKHLKSGFWRKRWIKYLRWRNTKDNFSQFIK